MKKIIVLIAFSFFTTITTNAGTTILLKIGDKLGAMYLDEDYDCDAINIIANTYPFSTIVEIIDCYHTDNRSSFEDIIKELESSFKIDEVENGFVKDNIIYNSRGLPIATIK